MTASEYLKLHAPTDWSVLDQFLETFGPCKLAELEYQGEIKKRDTFGDRNEKDNRLAV